MSRLARLFNGRLALVRLDAASAEILPWPDVLSDDLASGVPGGLAAAARLARLYPDALILAAGPLTGTLAPASCLAVACCPGPGGVQAAIPLMGHHGPALKACGLDFLIVTGKAAEPAALIAGHGGARLENARHLAGRGCGETIRWLDSFFPDSRASMIVNGPAGQRGIEAASASLESGGSLDRGALAAWMGAHHLIGLALGGGGPLPGPKIDTAKLWPDVSPQAGPGGFFEVLRRVPGGPRAEEIAKKLPAQAVACYHCPRPCLAQFRPAGGPGYVSLDHAAFAAMALAQKLDAPAVLAACADLGLSPAALALGLRGQSKDKALAILGAIASGQAACPPLDHPLPALPSWPYHGAGRRAALGLILGLCPVFLMRLADFPVEAALAGDADAAKTATAAKRLELALAIAGDPAGLTLQGDGT